MNVTVKLFATLSKERFEVETREYDTETTVGQVLLDLGISEKDAKIIFVNNRHAEIEQILHDGDILAIFPPIGGG